MLKKYPFKFLDAYTRVDSEFFFGRSDEIDALYEMVFQADLLLVYGASGTGKSSLIQCGLASKFQSHDWLALNIRRGSDLNASFEKALLDAGSIVDEPGVQLDWLEDDLISDNPLTTPTNSDGYQDSPLARRFKAIYLKYFKPLYLIFDQFEELYILGNKDEQQQFIQTVKQILQVEQPVKIILSIREEYLGYLYEFERAVPELLRKKLRVEPMNLDKVKTVIKGVGSHKQSNVHLQAGEEDAIASGIFDKIRGGENTLGIELPYLQVFLDKLYLQITQDERRQADATFTLAALEKMGDIGDVLRNFLDDQVLVTAQKLEQKPEKIWSILSPFVTLDGTKEPLSKQNLQQRLPSIAPFLVGATLQAFVNSRILRYTENEQLYEIAHDSLAKQIHAKRSDEEIAILEVQRLIKSQVALKAEAREYFTEKQLLFIEPYLSKFKPTEGEQGWIAKSRAHRQAEKETEAKQRERELTKTKQRLRTVRGLLAAAGVALLVAGWQYFEANREKTKAETALSDLKTENEKRLAAEAAKRITEFDKEIALAYGQLSGGNSCLGDETLRGLQKAVWEINTEYIKKKIQDLNQAIQKNKANCPLIKIQE